MNPFAKQEIGAMDLFASIDTDGSGTISRAELGVALKKSLKMGDKQIDALFVEADSDNSGSITMMEFAAALKKNPTVLNSPNLLAAVPGIGGLMLGKKTSGVSPIEYFHEIDTDGSGTLSLAELTAALKLNHISDEAINAIFAICDKDHSGGVSMLEWSNTLRERPELLPTKLEKPPPFKSALSPMELFAVIDNDGSGTLSRTEFSNALKARFMSDEVINKLFTEADADHSGSITMLEWSKAVKKMPELASNTPPATEFKTKLAPMDYFATMDTDSTGSISRAELKAALTKSNLSDAAIEKIFSIADKDGSGEISMLEWSKAIKTAPELLPEKLGVPGNDKKILNAFGLK